MSDLIDDIAAAAERKMRAVAVLAVRRIRNRLGNASPPSSRPGENPHRRTGRLRAGISADVTRHGDFIELTVRSDAPYTTHLEASGRPVISDLTDEFTEEVIQAVLAAAGERKPTP